MFGLEGCALLRWIHEPKRWVAYRGDRRRIGATDLLGERGKHGRRRHPSEACKLRRSWLVQSTCLRRLKSKERSSRVMDASRWDWCWLV